MVVVGNGEGEQWRGKTDAGEGGWKGWEGMND